MSPGRTATLPQTGYALPQRLFLGPRECRVRVLPEDGSTPTDLDLMPLPVARELREWLAVAVCGATGPSGPRRTMSSAVGTLNVLVRFTRHLAGRVAFALQATGKWLLRNAVVWSKTNPMPESVRDRLSTTYEMLFLLTPSPRYFFDLNPIREPLKHPQAADGSRVFGGVHKGHTGGVEATRRRRGNRYGTGKYTSNTVVIEPGAGRGNLVPTGRAHTAAHPRGRNPGDVWRLPTRPYAGSHVAPFPIDLPLRAIAAGCPPGGVVLDPFSGAATTCLAALQLGRAYIGIDVNAAFHDEALARLRPYLPDQHGRDGDQHTGSENLGSQDRGGAR